MKGFTFDDIPDQSGRTALVTGANTGIGYHIAEMLATNGAHVLMGCRSMDRARSARDDMLKAVPGAEIDIVELDLDTYVRSGVAAGRLRAFAELQPADVYMICVPTPFHYGG